MTAELASLEMLRDCKPDELAQLDARLRARPFEPGEVLMREGEAGSFFALLLRGSVTVTRETPAGTETLAVAGPGSIGGELALLRGQARTATVTASGAGVALIGDADDLEFLLGLRGVHDRIRDLASARLAQDVRPVVAVLADGTEIVLRPLLPADRAAYTATLDEQSGEWMRRRFFTASKPSARVIDHLLDIDFVDHFAWLALEDEHATRGLGVARYIRDASASDTAEVAMAVTEGHQGQGLGTLFLGAIGVAASAAGISRFVATVQADNAAMRTVFAKAGAKTAFSEPGVVQAELDTAAAADLLEPGLRAELHVATHDIVTAAGLALTTSG
ncbi:MAG: protein lysine acetyltransferase [Acidimicrobiaceae bacterium]|jgi:CRP-like cAMP-binding protein